VCAAVCEHAHLPLQSGSTRILKAMRRTYSRERYLKLVDEMRTAIPDLALTTDIIVGFPGETDDDFRETMEVVEDVGFDSAFTFVYRLGRARMLLRWRSKSPTTSQRDRIERLVELVQRIAAAPATLHASATRRRCSSRGRAAPTAPCSVVARGATRP